MSLEQRLYDYVMVSQIDLALNNNKIYLHVEEKYKQTNKHKWDKDDVIYEQPRDM